MTDYRNDDAGLPEQVCSTEPHRIKAPDYDFWYEKAKHLVEFKINGDKFTIDSVDVSDLTGTPHKDILKEGMRLIDRDYGYGAFIADVSFNSTYIDTQGEDRPMLILPLEIALEIMEDTSKGLRDAVRDLAFSQSKAVAPIKPAELSRKEILLMALESENEKEQALALVAKQERELIENEAVIDDLCSKADIHDQLLEELGLDNSDESW